MTNAQKEAAWLTTRIANLKDMRDHATFEIKECEEQLRTLHRADSDSRGETNG